MIDIDRLIEIWVEEARKKALDDDLSWWRGALANLRPDDESSGNDAPGSSP